MIGDVLTSSILCQAVKERFHSYEVHYLVNKNTTPVLENNPYIDKQIVFSPEMEESASLRKGLKTALKNEKYDIVIDVYSKLGSAEITKSTKAKMRIGYGKWYTKWAYTHTYKYSKTPKTVAGLAIENRMQLLEPIARDFPKYLKPKIVLTPKEKDKALATLKDNGVRQDQALVMVSMLGSSVEKTYPLHYLSHLLDAMVAKYACQLLLNYIPKQQAQVMELLSLVQPATKEMIIDKVYGKSLREFMALTSHCDIIMGNEGGAINMAKALDIPSFSIFSPWITREAWGLFENEKNSSFHLKDIDPELYRHNEAKLLKKEYDRFYKLMTPQAISLYLRSFLDKNLK